MIPYATISEAEEFFSMRLRTEAWDKASLDNQEKALWQATRAIDRLNYIGEPEGEQAFPRVITDDDGEETTTDDGIMEACCELALAYLSGVDTGHEFDNIRVVSHSQDFTKTTYNPNVQPEHIIAGIPSVEAWYLLRPYLRDPRTVHLFRRS